MLCCVSALLHKLEYDLKVACGADNDDMQFSLDHSHAEDLNIRTLGRCVRTRLYFTSESHLYTLLNVLMYSGTPPDYKDSCLSEEGRRIVQETAELSYLTQITIRLFDTPSKDINDPERFRCEISFSPGALDDETDIIPFPVVLKNDISCAKMLESLKMSIAAGKSQCNTPKLAGLSLKMDQEGGVQLGCPPTTPEKLTAGSQDWAGTSYTVCVHRGSAYPPNSPISRHRAIIHCSRVLNDIIPHE